MWLANFVIRQRVQSKRARRRWAVEDRERNRREASFVNGISMQSSLRALYLPHVVVPAGEEPLETARLLALVNADKWHSVLGSFRWVGQNVSLQ